MSDMFIDALCVQTTKMGTFPLLLLLALRSSSVALSCPCCACMLWKFSCFACSICGLLGCLILPFMIFTNEKLLRRYILKNHTRDLPWMSSKSISFYIECRVAGENFFRQSDYTATIESMQVLLIHTKQVGE